MKTMNMLLIIISKNKKGTLTGGDCTGAKLARFFDSVAGF